MPRNKKIIGGKGKSLFEKTEIDVIRYSLFIPRSLHRKLKILAPIIERTMTDIVVAAIEAYLPQLNQEDKYGKK